MMKTEEPGSLEEHLAVKRVAELEERLQRAEAENQLWRESMARLRDVAVNFAPAVAHAGALEDVRAMMRDPVVMEERITEHLAGGKLDGAVGARLARAKVHHERLHETSMQYAAAMVRAEARVKALTEEMAALEADRSAEG